MIVTRYVPSSEIHDITSGDKVECVIMWQINPTGDYVEIQIDTEPHAVETHVNSSWTLFVLFIKSLWAK